MTDIELYEKYFEHQAKTHPDLLHTATDGDKVFFRMEDTERKTSFVTGIRPDSYLFILLPAEYVVTDGNDRLGQKRINGGFIMAHSYHPRNNSDTELRTARYRAEARTDEIIEKMIADSRAGHPLFNYSLDADQDIRVQVAQRTGDVTYTGYLVTFEFSPFFRICPTGLDAPDWTDGGVTPFSL
jgi:uncharacterized short protein YbdD (DUF466 family)